MMHGQPNIKITITDTSAVQITHNLGFWCPWLLSSGMWCHIIQRQVAACWHKQSTSSIQCHMPEDN